MNYFCPFFRIKLSKFHSFSFFIQILERKILQNDTVLRFFSNKEKNES